MNILEIEFNGKGTESQLNCAKSIFHSEMKKVEDKYEIAKLRVLDGSMPQGWVDAWDSVLSNSRAIAAIERFAGQPASDTIDYQGFKTKSGSKSVSLIVESLATQEYKK